MKKCIDCSIIIANIIGWLYAMGFTSFEISILSRENVTELGSSDCYNVWYWILAMVLVNVCFLIILSITLTSMRYQINKNIPLGAYIIAFIIFMISRFGMIGYPLTGLVLNNNTVNCTGYSEKISIVLVTETIMFALVTVYGILFVNLLVLNCCSDYFNRKRTLSELSESSYMSFTEDECRTGAV